MINPYINRREKNLYFILSENSSDYTISPNLKKNIVIIMHLHYLDTLQRFLKYLNNIPDGIKVVVVSSVKNLLENTDKYIKENKLENIKLVYKENRGRDVSALLVTCREEILNYKYFCFIHDKKAGLEKLKEETDMWIENLWNNTIRNEEYIENVIRLFEERREIGLLVPPEPIGEMRSQWFMNNWGNNFEIAQNLLKKLNVKSSIDPDLPVITLGTVLWGKTESMYKLLKYNWNYEDFMEEPMPVDGTISHAIERSFSFVVQDAGFETGTIMCNSYAEKMMGHVQNIMYKMFDALKQLTPYQIENMGDLTRDIKIKDFYNKYKDIYLYGAGKIGIKCLNIMKALNCEPKGFIVSEGQMSGVVENVPMISIEQLSNPLETGIIITVGTQLVAEIEDILKQRGIKNYIKFIEI